MLFFQTDTNIILIFDKPFIFPQPYGVVLIIGTWNYPVCVLLLPLIGAIAAGNCAIIKPSEISPTSAKMFSDLIPSYLDKVSFRLFMSFYQVGEKVFSRIKIQLKEKGYANSKLMRIVISIQFYDFLPAFWQFVKYLLP